MQEIRRSHSNVTHILKFLKVILQLTFIFSKIEAFAPVSRRPFSSSATHRSSPKLHQATADNRAVPGSFLRWRASQDASGRIWDMQTAIATYEKGNRTLYLHAMIHYGSADYFAYYNDLNATVLFELLVDENLLTNDDTGLRRLRPDAVIQATPRDQRLAAQYGWACQADSIYYKADWIHADLSTQEFLEQLPSRKSHQSLWQSATKDALPAPAMEAATALVVGPPFLSTKTARRRLFSNLFVPGSAVASLLRAALWFTIPSPELSILILDWSSLTSMSVSQVTLPIGEALAKGQFVSAKQLIFGQVALLASKMNDQYADKDDLLITQRNERAMDVLAQLDPSVATVSLLYGCNHCPDLQRRLIHQGYQPTPTEWRTAWSVRLDDATVDDISHDDNGALFVALLVALPVYLAIGAVDWIASWQEVVRSPDLLDFSFLSSFYLLRHAVMYSAISKYVLDWDDKGTNGVDGVAK